MPIYGSVRAECNARRSEGGGRGTEGTRASSRRGSP